MNIEKQEAMADFMAQEFLETMQDHLPSIEDEVLIDELKSRGYKVSK